ncbi:MAG TPA: ASCH domain-containing protein [Candidatus Bathyarchaeia archaeon]|nr:ASCH domain-containing protein [Candidatus Bathyarchaeia archaeon]
MGKQIVRVPTITSKYPVEPRPDKYVIPFAPELVPLILSGAKVKTYRFGKKHDYLQVGDQVDLQNYKTQEIICRAAVTAKERTTFGRLPLTIPGHETYPNKERQRQVFSGYYAYLGRPVADDDRFLIFEFQMRDNQ